ncbi:hypothetical protein NL676_009363 [Syzygium grande]|nr:hypothetical protein NL676_009363 [Syzygium grande]
MGVRVFLGSRTCAKEAEEGNCFSGGETRQRRLSVRGRAPRGAAAARSGAAELEKESPFWEAAIAIFTIGNHDGLMAVLRLPNHLKRKLELCCHHSPRLRTHPQNGHFAFNSSEPPFLLPDSARKLLSLFGLWFLMILEGEKP